MLTPREVDAHTLRQVAILLEWDVPPDAQRVRPQRPGSSGPSAAQSENVGKPGYCEHGNLAPLCSECRGEVRESRAERAAARRLHVV